MAVFYRYDYTEITKNIHPCLMSWASRRRAWGCCPGRTGRRSRICTWETTSTASVPNWLRSLRFCGGWAEKQKSSRYQERQYIVYNIQYIYSCIIYQVSEEREPGFLAKTFLPSKLLHLEKMARNGEELFWGTNLITLRMVWGDIAIYIYRGTKKVRNSGLGPDPDQSAKNGPELGTRSGFGFWMPFLRLNRLVPMW